MKKYIALLLALMMLVSLAACGAAESGSQENGGTEQTGSPESGDQTGAPEDSSSGTGDPVDSTAETEGPADDVPATVELTGKLELIELGDRETSVFHGISFSGNRAGSAEYNSKAAVTEDIRCVFELNEWISPVPDTDATFGIVIYILKHRDDRKYYEDAVFHDEMDGLVYIFEMNQTEDYEWGSFYLNPEEVEPGYYDFVFVYEDKAIATLVTRFCPAESLGGKSDAEIDALMKGSTTR